MANTCTFEELQRKEKRGIVCDRQHLIDRQRLIQVQDRWKTKTAQKKLKEQVDKNLKDLGGRRRERIAQFYIGKASVDKKAGVRSLDPEDPATWDKSGINSRWNEHKRRDYNGLIVLTVVSRDVIKNNHITIDKQDYALMLEQLLLYHYKVDKKDVKLQNENFAQGGRGDNDGYAVYVAVKLE